MKKLWVVMLAPVALLAAAESYAYDCTNVSQYVDASSYNAGSIVKNGGNAYSCTVGGWCTVGGPYAPGTGWAWEHAWSALGACTGTSSASSLSSSVPSSSKSSVVSSSSSISSVVSSSQGSATGGVCAGLLVWNSTAVYNTDNLVQFAGVKYRAKWWTQGDNPQQSGQWGVWENQGSCGQSSSSSSVKSSLSSSSSSSVSVSSSSRSSVAGGRSYVTYAGTWNTSIYDLSLNNIPNYITHLNLAFVRPDTNYQAGSYAFDQSVAGFEFYEGAASNAGQRTFTAQQAQDLRNMISALKARGTQVWLSVGGWTYSQGSQWSNFNAPRVVALARDLGASGIDIDWESSGSNCNKQVDASFSCTKDAEVADIINSLYNEIQARNANLGISIAGWSTGAYYVAGTPFAEGKVQWGSPFGGTMYRVVKDHGNKINFINLMSYDAGAYYDPREGYEAYRAIYNGPINMGMEIAPEGAGDSMLKINAPAGTVYDADMLTGLNNVATQYYNVETMVNYIKNKGRSNDGFMLWQLWKQRVHLSAPSGAATENSAGQYVCNNLPLAGNCSQTIPSLPKLQ